MGKTKAKRQGPGRALIRNKNKKQIKERSNVSFYIIPNTVQASFSRSGTRERTFGFHN